MAVTARFKVSRHTPFGDTEEPYATEVELTPDYAGGKNKSWAEATPSGVIRLTITNQAAVDALPKGASIDVLLTKSEE